MYHDFSYCSKPPARKVAGCPTDSATRWSTRSPASAPSPQATAARHGRERICLHLGRLVGPSITAQVGNDRPIAGLDERRDLMAPQSSGVGEPMDQHHRPPFAAHLILDPHAANVDPHLDPLSKNGVLISRGLTRVTTDPVAATLSLLDWKRTIAGLYAEMRAASDKHAAWVHWRDTRARLFREHPE